MTTERVDAQSGTLYDLPPGVVARLREQNIKPAAAVQYRWSKVGAQYCVEVPALHAYVAATTLDGALAQLADTLLILRQQAKEAWTQAEAEWTTYHSLLKAVPGPGRFTPDSELNARGRRANLLLVVGA